VTDPDEASLRCRRGDRCTNTHPTTHTRPDGTTSRDHIPDWATTPGGLCRTDTTRVQRALEQLPRDYLELSLLLGKTGSTLDAPTGGTRELPVPIRLGVLGLQEDIVAEVDLWAEAVADHAGLPWHTQSARAEQAVRAGRMLAAGCTLLAAHLDTLLTLPPVDQVAWVPGEAHVQLARCPGGHWHPEGGVCREVHVREVWHDDHRQWAARDGIDGALALLGLHERAEQVEGRTHRAHRLWAPCPNPQCQALALERPEGSDRVNCRRCLNTWSLEEYEQRASILASAYEGAAA
jgi:hypothetical protein